MGLPYDEMEPVQCTGKKLNVSCNGKGGARLRLRGPTLGVGLEVVSFPNSLGCLYDKVSREFKKRVPSAKKLITRPIMTITSPNSPHIALTYTKLRSDHFFDHNYPPSWS